MSTLTRDDLAREKRGMLFIYAGALDVVALVVAEPCPDCGKDWPDGAAACPDCGLTIEAIAERLTR